MSIQFQWNEAKNIQNIRKHGIDFADVMFMFEHPMVTNLDDREDYGEERWIGIGLLRYGVGVVVFTQQERDKIRIISARKATKQEVRRYEQKVKN